MDPSSPYAMERLLALKDRFDVAFACDPDYDRHGIVTRARRSDEAQPLSRGRDLVPVSHRPGWPTDAAIGKTLVTSQHDRPRRREASGQPPIEVPVGFKWFVRRLARRRARLRRRGERRRVVPPPRRRGVDHRQGRHRPGLLAAEITARHRPRPWRIYRELDAGARRAGLRAHRRPRDARAESGPVATVARQFVRHRARRREDHRHAHACAGQRRADRRAQGGRRDGWFAARPSGTEDVYKIYAESFLGREHLARIQEEARAIVAAALGRLEGS